MQKLRRTADEVIATWKSSGAGEISNELREVLADLVRRQVGFLLRRDGPLAAIDPDALVAELTERWSANLDDARKQALSQNFASIAATVWVENEPKEVTRWLWMWDRSAPNAKEVEEQLFTAIQDHLRKRLRGILHLQRFANLRHKVDQDDLVSELYMKLAKTKIPRLSENQRQFFGLADKAIVGILLDMQKAAARRPRTAKGELFDVHPDVRTGQDQLKVLLNSENAEEELDKRVELEKRLAKLPRNQQEAFRLRRNGVSIAKIVEITGISRAQIGRYISQTKAYLADAVKGGKATT